MVNGIKENMIILIEMLEDSIDYNSELLMKVEIESGSKNELFQILDSRIDQDRKDLEKFTELFKQM